jgi:hypothetical protein
MSRHFFWERKATDVFVNVRYAEGKIAEGIGNERGSGLEGVSESRPMLRPDIYVAITSGDVWVSAYACGKEKLRSGAPVILIFHARIGLCDSGHVAQI